ncbi:hypothetical protein [Myroides odoratimimus]|uniref:hypothetical protein n=1 Tax=Myroides odoratimimus TaxID=76832 RepID=UPI0025757F68|nr:hypothetical protein [Myroides odoratimimus]MDM1499640.1 hypothetical protein [Myroides odoratimimus]
MNQKELNNFLIDSRKSFRNLFIYIDRIKDIMKYIDSILEGHQYSEGHTQFSNIATEKTRARLNKWAWDWLPMYNYEFHFGVNQETNVSFSIIIIADTGFYDTSNKDKLDIDQYGDVEQSESKIIFCVGKNNWFKNTKTEEDLAFEKIYSNNCDEYNGITNTSKYIYAYAYNLNSFLTKGQIRANLEDFINKCNDKKIDTIVIKKEIQ